MFSLSPCRMECLIALQRYTECLEMIEAEVKKNTMNADFFVIRAQLNSLFGEVATCI